MATNNPVVIAGQIDDSLLMEAIDKLVQDVANKADAMAQGFQEGINKMDSAMATFATNQQTHINTITQAWGGLATSFTQMQTAQQNATRPRTSSSGNQSQSSTNDDTIAGIKQRIKEEKKVLDVQKLETEEQRKQANLVGDLQKRLAYNTKPRYTLPEVLGMDTSTIDQITQKMAALRKVEFDPKDATTAAKIRDEYQKLAEQKRKLMGVNSQLENSNKSLASAFNYIRNRIVYAFTIGTITGFVKDLIKVRQEYELLERSIGILTGSMEKGTQIFNELSEMALKSPFTLVELGTAAKQLSAYNFAASEVVDTTRRLADISAALGVPMERLVYNLGQIKAQGVLNARDARDFANAGFAIVPMLAQLYTKQKMFGDEIVTTSKVYDMMSKKLVTYGDVMRVIESATDEGGKFFDYQAKQADTLKVQYANLALAYNNMLNEIGTEHQDLLSMPARTLKTLFKHWRDIVNVVKVAITAIIAYKSQSVMTAIADMLNRYINGWVKLTWNVKNAKTAMAAFNTVAAANPWGLIATGISAVVSYLLLFNNETSQATEMVSMFGEEGTKTINKITNLKKVLAATEQTSSLYNKTLNELNTIMEEYGITLVKEGDTRDEVNSKIERTIELVKEEASARNYANSLQKSQSRYDEAVESARKNFEEALRGAFTGDGVRLKNEELRQNASVIADVYSHIMQENIDLIANKTEEEYKRGMKVIMQKMNDAAKDIGLSQETINAKWWSGWTGKEDFWSEFVWSMLEAYEQYKKTNNVIDQYYQKTKDVATSTMTAKEKMLAYGNALRSVSGDAKVLYDKVMDIVELAKNKYSIDIDIKAITGNIPQSFLNMSEEERLNNIFQYASGLKAGLKQKDMDVKTQLEHLAKLMEAERKMSEEADRNKDTNKKQKKDVLGEALTKEIQLINEAQKRYSEYRKMGLSATNAQLKVSEEYNKSLANVSNTLAKFGIATKPMKELAYMNSRELKAYFQTLLDGATRLGNAKGIEAAEKAIANLNVEITKLDTKKITDGLNNELGKLKDEYELAVELDANPELGDAFTQLFDIDPNNLPHSIDEYAASVAEAINVAFQKRNPNTNILLSLFNLSDKDLEAYKKGIEAGWMDEQTYKEIEDATKKIREMRKKDVEDTIKQTKELQYKLADVNEKIIIEKQKLADLERKYDKETNDDKKKLYALQIQEQKEAIQKLEEDALEMMPFYKNLFDGISGKSRSATKKLVSDAKQILEAATISKDAKGRTIYTLTDEKGNSTTISARRYLNVLRQVNQEGEKIESTWEKIARLSDGNKDNGEDWEETLSLVAGEVRKIAEGVRTIGNIAESLGLNENTTEYINDVAQGMDGIASIAEGVYKFSTDPIGATTSIISGAWSAISAFLDNSDKRIQRSIQDSERRVQRLELAYKDLQYAIEDAFGTATVGAEKAALANKTLQLTELKRQLTLQESRTGKNRDEDAIINLKGQIKDLEREIESGYKSIITNLLGISDVGSAVENMVQSVVNALRNGENAIDAWNTSIDDMIVNMITRFVSAQVVGPMFQKVIDDMTKTVAQRGVTTAQELEEIKRQRDAKQAEVDEWSALYNRTGLNAYNQGATKLQEELDALNKQIVELEDQAKQQTEFTKQDLEYMVEHLAELKANGGDWMSYLQELLEQYGLMGGANETQLSNLQQGIQGITETTAGALEAYCNNMLTQIYVQVGIQSRMLLELQNSYQIQAAIHAILTGVVNANGMAFRVELMN